MRVHKQVNLQRLSSNEAWDLFVSRSGDQLYDLEIQSIAKEVVHACRGVPLTIIALSYAMRRYANANATVWRLVLGRLQRHLDTRGGVMEHKYGVLRFRYSHLKKKK